MSSSILRKNGRTICFLSSCSENDTHSTVYLDLVDPRLNSDPIVSALTRNYCNFILIPTIAKFLCQNLLLIIVPYAMYESVFNSIDTLSKIYLQVNGTK